MAVALFLAPLIFALVAWAVKNTPSPANAAYSNSRLPFEPMLVSASTTSVARPARMRVQLRPVVVLRQVPFWALPSR